MTKNKLNGYGSDNSESKKLKTNGNGSSTTHTTLMWFRTDLRIEDNRALGRALINSRISNSPLIFLFLVSINEWKSHDYSPWKINFWLRNAQDLANQLNELGFPFIFKTIDSIQEAPKKVLEICQEFNSSEVFYNIDYEVNELKRDRLTTELLEGKGIKVRKFHDQCVVPPGEVLTDKDAPYSMFTPFKNKWYKNVYWKMDEPDSNYLRDSKSVPGDEDIKLVKDSNLRASNPELFSSKLPSNLDDFGFTKEQEEYSLKHYPSGHKVAYEKLKKFGKEKLSKYKVDRDFPSLEGTTKLSMYLSLGVISARQCVNYARSLNKDESLDVGNTGIVCWISELVWRDFYRHILVYWPKVCKNQPFKESGKLIKWHDDPKDERLNAWCAGKTGFPIVDAAIRQLVATGWMHNRLRMIVSSFFVKDLLLDWRKGERFFMNNLIDGDLASNNGGWQWSASTGTDSQPYFRIFNPLNQAERFDPKGEFIRKWVPELKGLEGKAILDPHGKLGKKEFEALNYPRPIVDHSEMRKLTLKAFEVAMKKK